MVDGYIYASEFPNPLYPQVPFDGVLLWLWYCLSMPWNIWHEMGAFSCLFHKAIAKQEQISCVW